MPRMQQSCNEKQQKIQTLNNLKKNGRVLKYLAIIGGEKIRSRYPLHVPLWRGQVHDRSISWGLKEQSAEATSTAPQIRLSSASRSKGLLTKTKIEREIVPSQVTWPSREIYIYNFQRL